MLERERNEALASAQSGAAEVLIAAAVCFVPLSSFFFVIAAAVCFVPVSSSFSLSLLLFLSLCVFFLPFITSLSLFRSRSL